MLAVEGFVPRGWFAAQRSLSRVQQTLSLRQAERDAWSQRAKDLLPRSRMTQRGPGNKTLTRQRGGALRGGRRATRWSSTPLRKAGCGSAPLPGG